MTDPTETALYDYEHGTNVLAASGHMHAVGDRVLCRAILENDHYKGGIHLVTYTTQDAIAFEIVSIGPKANTVWQRDMMEPEALQLGMHIDVKSVAADRVNAKDATGRYWLVPVTDIVAILERVEKNEASLWEAVQQHIESKKGFMASLGPAPGLLAAR